MSETAEQNQIAAVQEASLYRLRAAEKRYGEGDTEVVAVAPTNLEIASGEFVAVVGPSGSGKTTLLQLLGALDRPSAGEVLFEGNPLERLGDGELARLRRTTLGFIFQQFNLIPTLTARQNVEVALAPAGPATVERRRRADDLLAEVGLAARAQHLPSELSGGEQQRVAIARALANEPRVLLADEPTGNLDTATGEEFMESVERLWRAQGLTVILVTHDRAIADRARRVVHMRDGAIVSAAAEPASRSAASGLGAVPPVTVASRWGGRLPGVVGSVLPGGCYATTIQEGWLIDRQFPGPSVGDPLPRSRERGQHGPDQPARTHS